jgi:hypothetical protein
MKKIIQLVAFLFAATALVAQVKASNVKIYPKNKVSITTTGGFELEDAYLVNDDGIRVSDSNVTELNKNIILLLVIKSGWKAVDGKVKLTLGQQIITNTGVTILKNNDVFGGNGEGTLEDAKYIQAKAVITSMNKPIKYFTVKFKMTDVIGKGTISGTYKFYIRP